MTNGRQFDRQATYRIRVGGNLDLRWADWFDGFEITPSPGNETLLVGPVRDQAALYGLLLKIRDLGLPLLLVARQDQDAQRD
jgi:hypothetical protein